MWNVLKTARFGVALALAKVIAPSQRAPEEDGD